MLWDYARTQKALISKNGDRIEVCAIAGHIAFHIGLAFLAILLSYLLGSIADPHIFKPWYSKLAFVAFIEGTDGPIILLLFVVFAAVVLLLLPMLVTYITKLCSAGISGSNYLKQPSDMTSKKEEAQTLLSEVESLMKGDTYGYWETYYPMWVIGDLIEINAFNVIPWLTFALSGWLWFRIGIETTTAQYIGGLLLSLLIGLIFMLAVVPLWKLSSIINASIYHSYSGANCSELVKRLKEFIEECEKEEKRTHQEMLAREKEEAKRKQSEKLKKAAELYAQATQGKEPNLNFLARAADMGDPSACREYGKILFLESTSDLLLKAEQEHKCELAAGYLAQVKDQDAETEFLWLACRIRYESNNVDEWKKMLDRVRAIKASGNVSENLTDSVNTMIQLLVQTINGMETKQQTSQPRRGHYYCRFYNAGICNHQSNEYFIYKCTDPVNQSCLYAKLNNGIAYKEY